MCAISGTKQPGVGRVQGGGVAVVYKGDTNGQGRCQKRMVFVGALLFVRIPPPKICFPDSHYLVKSRTFVFLLSYVHCPRVDDGRLLHNVAHSMMVMAVADEGGGYSSLLRMWWRVG
jgi:hypothetical protein